MEKYQPILSDSACFNTSCHRLHVSRAREERVHADLFVSARCAEAEAIAYKLRTELATAKDCARTTQKQLQNPEPESTLMSQFSTKTRDLVFLTRQFRLHHLRLFGDRLDNVILA